MLKNRDVEPFQADFINRHKEEFLSAMDDDFNTPRALAALFNLINDTNKFIDEGPKDSGYFGVIFHAVDILENFARNIFGLFLKEFSKDITPELELLLQERQAARASKNYQRSDQIRDILKAKGIAVEDGTHGQTWRWM